MQVFSFKFHAYFAVLSFKSDSYSINIQYDMRYFDKIMPYSNIIFVQVNRSAEYA